ncbi:hypothetical protein ZIOFF_073547 [Zingiber officinale]|uniref:Uncharacterized protein n=1 Tax=Zingiber officinale TaxID=94328 RepID=A0A8J5ESS2_ZINOF|nr:hypothetical protein ZIOFF_073547 [Zingiber officinale]
MPQPTLRLHPSIPGLLPAPPSRPQAQPAIWSSAAASSFAPRDRSTYSAPVTALHLQRNAFSGPLVPPQDDVAIPVVDLSYNQLWGTVPLQLAAVGQGVVPSRLVQGLVTEDAPPRPVARVARLIAGSATPLQDRTRASTTNS